MKRRRPVFTCSRCRNRKVKCDKNQPCNSCVSNKTPNLCRYDDNDQFERENKGYVKVFRLSPGDEDSKHISLHELNGNDIDVHDMTEDDEINIYERYTPATDNEGQKTSLGPLTWSFIQRKEPALNMLLRYIRSTALSCDSDSATEHMYEEDLGERNDSPMKRTSLDKTDLLNSISAILKSKKVVWSMVCVFFDHFYPYMPLIDEISFKSEISRITRSEQDENGKLGFNVERADDLALIGTLLIISRVSYLLQHMSNTSLMLDEIEIGTDAIEMAAACFSFYSITDNMTFAAFQGLLALRVYQRIAPEFSEGINYKGPRVYNGILIQIAFSLGLNRDRDLSDKRLMNLRKKSWVFLVGMDVTESLTFGAPLSVNMNFSDVSLLDDDEVNEESSNHSCVEIERHVVSHMRNSQPRMENTMERLSNILHIKKRSKVKDLLLFINEIEKYLVGGLDISNQPNLLEYGVQRRLDFIEGTYRLKMSWAHCMIVLSMYQHLAVHWEHKGNRNQMLISRKKIFDMTIKTMIPVLHPFKTNINEVFGPSGVLFTCSFFMQAVYRSCLVNIEFYIRLMYHSHHLDEIYDTSEERQMMSDVLKRALRVSEKCILLYIEAIADLSKRKIRTENCARFLSFFLETIKQEKLYFSELRDKTIGSLKYTEEFLKDFISTCEGALHKVDTDGSVVKSTESSYNILEDHDNHSFNLDFKDLNFDTLNDFDFFDFVGWPFHAS